ncbi:MAG: uroporphyrinogen-III C-methyltransferase [Acidobacteria bacterium]|nr:uroporphyrinogen-III C-methyltransferase [Acidobacteriota bacterium]
MTGSTGCVSLVGAGPGYPDLLTVRAVARLKAADLVLFDALVSPEVVALADRAQRFCVGKRAGRKSVQQETIVRLMIRAARRGRRVVRLKCGDPYVLGRGAEEAVALRAAGIPFDVVQGVTSAVAAPALAGIPLTHRGLASGFVVVSGHSDTSYGPVLRSLEPGSATVVVLMGLAHRHAIAACLLERGWPSNTAAAVVFAAASSRERTWTGTLRTLGDTPAADDTEDPGTIVVGPVVHLHHVLTDVGMSTPAAEGKG